MKIYLGIILLFFVITKTMAEVEEFQMPLIEGLRMDRCLSKGNCDEAAAYMWCQQKGYRKTIYWEIDRDIGKRSPTKIITSKKICSHERCDGFRTIVCYK